MGTVTAKQLKQKTGEVIRRVKSGERLTVTFRGKPVAVITQPTVKEIEALEELRPFAESWKDIEQTLERAKPEFKGWREATKWVRNRT
ncbi:MAG: type II toxin-antitoxin system prevent-host-death family antitoxin [Deltaproteobacteria bacterium]|nr:type II toxin-antitoxin system prevent-host-death family antitoxin [Deltaproteobacteria bacterium]